MITMCRLIRLLVAVSFLCASQATPLTNNGTGNQDCQVSHWGPWGACDPLTNEKTRTRHVQVAPMGYGSPCPVLVERADCDSSLVLEAADAGLSVPLSSDVAGPRAAAIAQVASRIANIPRSLVVGGATYPLYQGPEMLVAGSLSEQIHLAEVLQITQLGPVQATTLAGLVGQNLPTLTSMQAIADLYSQLTAFMDLPMSTDISDEEFGQQRLTYKSFVLRMVGRKEFMDTPFTITDAQMIQRCGATLKKVREKQDLFVEDFSTVAQWNDPLHPEKYVPSSLAFFCWHPKEHKLIPIEIRLLATSIAYTPFDATNDWILAKMAVETASNNYHSIHHMVSTHGSTIPVRVELMRNMAEIHPIRALLQRHDLNDFGFERISIQILFNTSTILDQTSGWGATGSLRYMYEIAQHHLSARQTFKNDVINRGLRHFGSHHRYAYYASQYWDVISRFVSRYICVYYRNDRAVQNDFELQNWATAVSKVPQLRDFPSKLKTRDQLADVITHLIFTSSLTHHGMNGYSTWMSMAAPYSIAALWKPLPTAKTTNDAPLNLMDYTMPVPLLPLYVSLISLFSRPVPSSQSFLSTYNVAPFTNEVALQPAIKEFVDGLKEVENTIVDNEQGEKWPYVVLRPSILAFSPWV